MPIKISFDFVYRNTTELRTRKYVSSSNGKQVCCRLSLMRKLAYIIRNDSVRNDQWTLPLSVIKTCRLMLYGEGAYHGLGR